MSRAPIRARFILALTLIATLTWAIVLSIKLLHILAFIAIWLIGLWLISRISKTH